MDTIYSSHLYSELIGSTEVNDEMHSAYGVNYSSQTLLLLAQSI